MKTILICMLSMFMISCASTRDKINQGSAEASYGMNALENAASTVDRAIATEKSIRDRFNK